MPLPRSICRTKYHYQSILPEKPHTIYEEPESDPDSRNFITLDRERSGRNFKEVLHWLKLATRQIQPFVELLSQTPAFDRSSIELPEELPKAWLHLLMSLVCIVEDTTLFIDQMNVCNVLLVEGMRKVIQRANQRGLSEHYVFTPFQLNSLLNFNLLQDITRVSPDINTTYWEYMQSLVSCLNRTLHEYLLNL